MELLIELLLAELLAIALRLALVRLFSWLRVSSASLAQFAVARAA